MKVVSITPKGDFLHIMFRRDDGGNHAEVLAPLDREPRTPGVTAEDRLSILEAAQQHFTPQRRAKLIAQRQQDAAEDAALEQQAQQRRVARAEIERQRIRQVIVEVLAEARAAERTAR